MSQKKKRIFTSAREVFETYFPDYSRKKKQVEVDGYSSISSDPTGKLAEEFAASLQKKATR